MLIFMNKKILAIAFVAIMVLALATPVMAAKPSEINDVWFVWSLSGGATNGNDPTWTGDGTILHNQATYTWSLTRTVGGNTGTPTVIGTVVTESNLMFNTLTSQGNVLIKATLTFTEADKTKNPYGVGTLECTAVAKITEMNPKNNWQYVFGKGEGFIVSNTGTGDFADAKLKADLVMGYIPATGAISTEGIFFGTHQRVNGEGTIVYH
jgi:hypothetical protein